MRIYLTKPEIEILLEWVVCGIGAEIGAQKDMPEHAAQFKQGELNLKSIRKKLQKGLKKKRLNK